MDGPHIGPNTLPGATLTRRKKLNYEVKFCNLDPQVPIGTDIIGLDKVAEIRDTEHDALEAFSAEVAGAAKNVL